MFWIFYLGMPVSFSVEDFLARLSRWATIAILFWFNVEVWGRVVWTIITW